MVVKHGIRGSVLAVLMAALSSTSANAQDYFAFGDSLSDNGNLFIVSGENYPPTNQYYEGRASDGETWTERLGFDLGRVPNAQNLTDPDGGFSGANYGYNFAHFGATVLDEHAPSRGQSVLRQIGSFRNKTRSGALTISNDDVFTIWAGVNDYLAYGETDTQKVAQEIRYFIKVLNHRGAKNILVLDQPHWGDTPFGLSRSDRENINLTMDRHNLYLQRYVNGLSSKQNVDVYYVSMSALYDDVLQNPGAYGFTIVAPGPNTTGHCLGDGLVLSDCPSTYAFYDSLHPSSAMHVQIASYVGAQYQAIAAQKSYSRIAVSAASPAMALQSKALKTDGGKLAATGWSVSGDEQLQFISYTDVRQSGTHSMEFTPDSILHDDQFSLAGLKTALPNNTRVAFVLSKGTPLSGNLSGHPVAASSGWGVQMTHPVLGLDVSLSTSGLEQSFERQRATGFARDPVVRASFEQTQTLTTIGVDKGASLAGLDLRLGGSLGLAEQRRSAVTEIARTQLVTRNSPASQDLSEAGELHVSAQYERVSADTAWRVGGDLSAGRINGEGYSAWSLLGADQFTSTDYISARTVSKLDIYGSFFTNKGLATEARFTVGQSDLGPVNAVQLYVSFNW